MWLVVWLGWGVFANVSMAYGLIVTEQNHPYEIVPIDTPLGETSLILGELDGYPIMYEISADKAFTLTVQLAQLPGRSQPHSLLVVKQNDRGGGVTTVARMLTEPDLWSRRRDSGLGVTLLESPVITQTVEAGVYRLEVSSPDNTGLFMLRVGDTTPEATYWEKLSAARLVQAWFGLGLVHLLKSQTVYLPIIVLFLVVVAWRGLRWRVAARRG